jgi:hypothetical protein
VSAELLKSPRQLLRLAAAAGIAVYGFARFNNPEYWDLLDDVNLAVHEAGHVLFQVFGDPMVVLGGSVLQLVVPAIFVGYFFVRHEWFAASVIMAWLGASLSNLALYIGDARAQELPLLGGENVIHDWWYLLIEWDMLPADLAIANWVRFASAVSFAVAVVGCIRFSPEPVGADDLSAPAETTRPRARLRARLR